MNKQELNQLIKEGQNIKAVATYSDSSIFIGMVDIEYGIDDSMVGYTIYRGSNNYNPKPFSRKIYYDNDRTYIKLNQIKYDLSDFIRTDLG